MRIKIDNRGRITIPEAIRETLGFNDVAYLEVENNKIIITKEIDPIILINGILDDVSACEDKLEYVKIIREAKNKMEDL